MSKARIMRYGQILAILDTDPDISSMVCVRPGESIDAVMDEVTDPESGKFVVADMCGKGRIRIVTSIGMPEYQYKNIAMPRDTLDQDALCKVAQEGRCLFFQPVNKELSQW